jgi:DNA-binding transcriptional LysR family regulator
MVDLLEEEFDLAIRPYVPPDSSLMVRLADWRHMLCTCCAVPRLTSKPIPSRRTRPIFRPTTAFAMPSTRSETSGASLIRRAGLSRCVSRETWLRPTRSWCASL